MTIEMDLVRADPKLGITPHLMERAETEILNLNRYVVLLMQDLMHDTDPFLRAMAIAEEGNVALAKRYVAGQKLDLSDLTRFRTKCDAIEKETKDSCNKVNRRFEDLQSRLEPEQLDNFSEMQRGWKQAIQQEKYHRALNYLARGLDILDDLGKEEKESKESAGILIHGADDISANGEEVEVDAKTDNLIIEDPAISTTNDELTINEAHEADTFDEAIKAWQELTRDFNPPLRTLLRPKQRSESIPFLEAAELLKDIQNLISDRRDVKFAFSSFFYLTETEREFLLEDLYEALVIFGEKELEKLVLQDKDFESAWLVYQDLILIISVRANKLSLSKYEEIYRLGIEAKAAIHRGDLKYTWDLFSKELDGVVTSLRRRQHRKLLSLGKMYFFYYRIRELEAIQKYNALVEFYVSHNTEVANSISHYPQLSRTYEMAQQIYRSAQLRLAEKGLVSSELSENITIEATLDSLTKTNPYKLASFLNEIVLHFKEQIDESNATLFTMYKLLSILFSIEKIEEVVFIEEDILDLIRILETKATGKDILLVSGSTTASLHIGVLTSLRHFIQQIILAVSMTDLILIRECIGRATEYIREQRSYLHAMDSATRHLWHMQGDRWISLLVGVNRALSRETKLQLTLLSDEIFADEPSSIVIQVKNIGQYTAKDIEIALAGTDVRLLGDSSIRTIPILRPGDENSVSYTVSPLTSNPNVEIRLLTRYVDADKNPNIDHENRVLSIISPRRAKMPRRSPYVWGHPLPKQSKVFFGREDVFEFVGSRFFGEERNKVFAIQGERRMGKTSILYQLGPRKILGNSRVVYFDFQGRYANFNSIPEFLYNFARRVRSEARLPDHLKVTEPEFLVGYGKYYEVFEQWLDEVEIVLEDKDTRIVIVFDEFEKLLGRRLESKSHVTQELVEELLQYIRSLVLSRTKFNWIIAGSWSLVTKQRDYFSSLFGMALSYWVSYLKQEDALALIQEPVKDFLYHEQNAMNRILRLTGGHPFHIQIMCDELFQRARQSNNPRVTVADVNKVIDHTLTQVTQESFHIVWTSLTNSTSRKLLAAMAEAIQSPGEYISKNDVLKYLRRRDPTISEQAFNQVLDVEEGELINRELLEIHPVEINRIRIRSELLYRWLKKANPLSKVLREER
jgi:hypothetical protein